MDTLDEVFVAFGGPTAFAKALEIKTSTASEMRRRRSIPVEYWQRLLHAAQQNGVEGITYEKLVSMHTPARHGLPVGAAS